MKSFPYPRSGFAGSLLMVVAPSGAGKSSLVKALLQKIDQIELSISYTTRSPRSGEQHGREYHFVNLTEFQRMEQAGEFLEHAEVHDNRYGTSRAWIEQRLGQGVDVLLEIDWQGAQQVRERFADDPRVGITGIFILPPSFETLEERLRNRGQDSEPIISRRLLAAGSEIAHAPEFEHVIINQDFDSALDDLVSIVRAARTRYSAQHARHRRLFAQLGLGGENS
ncbi:MAG: guanylate kinase [Burkholderiales bacterium]|jgi:guanylate kinase